MDFGDILNKWNDEQKGNSSKQKQPQVSHKKLNAPTKEEKEVAKQNRTFEELMADDNKRTANPMEIWLNRYGTVDKDEIADEAAEEHRLESREYLQSMKPEARIDLHGLTRDEAWDKLNDFVTDSKKRNLKKILIVHGKGNHSNGSDPVLGPMVRTFIEQDSRLGTSGHPDRSWGGNGATWVIIK